MAMRGVDGTAYLQAYTIQVNWVHLRVSSHLVLSLQSSYELGECRCGLL